MSKVKRLPLKEEKKQKPFDFMLLLCVSLLLGLGIIMVLSASSPSSLAESGSSYTYFFKQLNSAIVGILLMIFISKIDYRIYRNKKIYLAAYAISVGVLLLVMIPGIGVSVNGAARWIKLGVQFQPSEITKIGMIIFFAAILTENKDRLKKFGEGFIGPFLFLAVPVLILVLVQSHLSVTIVLVLVISIMMLVAGSRLLHFILVGIPVATLGGIGLYLMAKFTTEGAYRIARITSFLNPWADPTDTGWQVIQGLYAVGSGGFFGVGLRSKYTKIFVYT
jgi:cell division protein FtsW